MHLANDPHPAPDPAPFWAVLRDYLRHAFTMFGAPIDIAKQLWLSRADHKLTSAWLRVLEQMLRRLVFIDALACAPNPALAERKFRRRLAMPANTGAHFNLENSETWRACFDLRAADHRRRARPRPSAAPVVNLIASAPLALRFEALVRGYNGREQLAARLARILARNRARVWRFLTRVRACDRAKPGFDQVALLTECACDTFNGAIAAACDTS